MNSSEKFQNLIERIYIELNAYEGVTTVRGIDRTDRLYKIAYDCAVQMIRKN